MSGNLGIWFCSQKASWWDMNGDIGHKECSSGFWLKLESCLLHSIILHLSIVLLSHTGTFYFVETLSPIIKSLLIYATSPSWLPWVLTGLVNRVHHFRKVSLNLQISIPSVNIKNERVSFFWDSVSLCSPG
jgi:hypothetical protein